jgi:hypothetical protein
VNLDTLNVINALFMSGEDVTLNEGQLLRFGSMDKSFGCSSDCCNYYEEKIKRN